MRTTRVVQSRATTRLFSVVQKNLTGGHQKAKKSELRRSLLLSYSVRAYLANDQNVTRVCVRLDTALSRVV